MLQTLEAVIDTQGKVHLLEPITLPTTQRALVTILRTEVTHLNGPAQPESIVGTLEIVDEDLAAASEAIATLFNQALQKSAEELEAA